MKMWVQEVKRLFFKLSEVEVAPDSAHDWAEAVLEMAGWIVDMAIGLEHAGDSGGRLVDDRTVNQPVSEGHGKASCCGNGTNIAEIITITEACL